MKRRINNPQTNKLGPGVTAKALSDAITQSGYPLQLVVANLLRPDFRIQEEWSFFDKDINDTRAIDILAEKWFWDIDKEQPHVRPALNLLIECKLSTLPYVFFVSSGKPWIPNFPVLVGLRSRDITVSSDDDPSTWTMPVLHALELDSHPFISNEPEYCASFAKCERSGSSLRLSGEDVYRNIVLPISKAVHHFEVAETPVSTALWFDCHLTLGIALVDAPMVGVSIHKQSHKLESLPWVRLMRHETGEIPDWSHSSNMFAIDVIHKDYFVSYLKEHLLPFAAEFSKMVLKHQNILVSGKAFVSGMGRDSWNNLEQRIQPETNLRRNMRIFTIASHLSRLLVGKILHKFGD